MPPLAAWFFARLVFLGCVLVSVGFLTIAASKHPQFSDEGTRRPRLLPGIQMPAQFPAMEDCPHSHDPAAAAAMRSSDPELPVTPSTDQPGLMRVSMKHREDHHLHTTSSKADSLQQSIWRDAHRVQRIGMKTLYSASLAAAAGSHSGSTASIAPSPLFVGGKDSPPPFQPPPSAPPVAVPSPSPSPSATPLSIGSHVESGVTLGSGEYFMDVYLGTPPRHFLLIIDTGSDLIWTQCNPCEKCYQQEGPIFSPNVSSSYKLLMCSHPQCKLVYNADDGKACLEQKLHSCRYSYWYGDKSNTTGDLALETITLNLGDGRPYSLSDIVFGCGHSNEGLFRGAGGLLGLGKGPLSFPSQLDRRFGRKFSYCLVNRNSNLSISSKLTFGEDEGIVKHPEVQYTSFVKHASVATFYYLSIAKVQVGGEEVEVPATAWAIDGEGQGGTIIDTGTTLTYFVKQVYEGISQAFAAQIKYPRVDSPLLRHCYDVSGHATVELPTFSVVFEDGASFSPPLENYFLEVEAAPPTLCLAILEAPPGSPSILGNYLQQNIHILYDLDNYKLGFAPMVCSDL